MGAPVVVLLTWNNLESSRKRVFRNSNPHLVFYILLCTHLWRVVVIALTDGGHRGSLWAAPFPQLASSSARQLVSSPELPVTWNCRLSNFPFKLLLSVNLSRHGEEARTLHIHSDLHLACDFLWTRAGWGRLPGGCNLVLINTWAWRGTWETLSDFPSLACPQGLSCKPRLVKADRPVWGAACCVPMFQSKILYDWLLTFCIFFSSNRKLLKWNIKVDRFKIIF